MRSVYLIGVPGSGKSTLVAAATAGLEPVQETRPFAHLVYPDGVVELGRRRDSGFSGTDALSMGVMPKAVQFLQDTTAPVVFGEGDRLASDRFFRAATEAGPLRVVWLDAPQELADERRAARGSSQKAAWLKGRVTKVERLAGSWASLRLDASRPVEELAPILRALIWPDP